MSVGSDRRGKARYMNGNREAPLGRYGGVYPLHIIIYRSVNGF